MSEGPIDHDVCGTTTRAELAEQLHDLGFSRRQAHALVSSVFDLLVEGLQRDGEVKLSGFGKFEVVDRAPKTGRNPSTGEEVAVDGHRSVVLRPSPKLRDALTTGLDSPFGRLHE